MQFKKYINRNSEYDVLEADFDGMPITFRIWKDGSHIVEIKVDDYFAKANGYQSVTDMAAKTVGQKTFDAMFGGVPNWIRVTEQGEFFFLGINKSLLN